MNKPCLIFQLKLSRLCCLFELHQHIRAHLKKLSHVEVENSPSKRLYMKNSEFSESQTVGILKKVAMGAKAGVTCKKRGISEPRYNKQATARFLRSRGLTPRPFLAVHWPSSSVMFERKTVNALLKRLDLALQLDSIRHWR